MKSYAVGAMTRPIFPWAPLPWVVVIEPAHAKVLRWDLEIISYVGLKTKGLRVTKGNTFV